MNIIVLGSGVVGVTTAYYLAAQGANVTVFDRQNGPAEETSFGNAGQISPGYSTPWAAPGIPFKAVRWIFQQHAPLSINLDGSLWQLQWMANMLKNCTVERYSMNKERMMRIAEYSRDCLRQLRADTDIQYENRSKGTLQVFRDQAQFDGVEKDTHVLAECGVQFKVLDKNQLQAVEPALKDHQKLIGGLHLPEDETGDCYKFTNALAEKAKVYGVQFKFNQVIEQLVYEGDQIRGVIINGKLHQADQYVLALGSFSRELAKPLYIDLPVYPVKGYSLTAPIIDFGKAPQSTVLDETYKIALTRFDQRIRIGGMAELSGFNRDLREDRRATLQMVAADLFPCTNYAEASFWTGLRPMTPDSTPIIGYSRFKNLLLNTGHGTLGWTMACGSGKIISDLAFGKNTDIDLSGLSLDRYHHAA